MLATIQVTGLKELRAALKEMDAELPKQMRVAFNKSSQLVIDYAKRWVPSKSGRAAGSLKVRSSQLQARIASGGTRAPYFPWLDFGGEGRIKGRPPARPFIKSGRYIYKGLAENRDEITAVMSTALTALATDAGLEVT